MKPFILALSLFWSLASAAAANDGVTAEFACGTNMQGGSFYADTGSVVCSDREKIDIKPSRHKPSAIFCFYQATCAAATPVLKGFVESLNPGKKWEKLTDDEINKSLINASLRTQLPFFPELISMNVQCLGAMGEDKKPICPGVNDCVNNRQGRSLYWNVKALKPFDPAKAPADNSDGFGVEQIGKGVPFGKQPGKAD